MLKIYPLTKKDILDKVDQIEVFSILLNIDRETIEEAIAYNIKISSPLRTDNHPSVGFRFNNKNKLRMRDFAGYFWGDIFDLAALLTELDINTKEGFQAILVFINNLCTDTTTNIDRQSTLQRIQSRRTIINISIRHWNSNDYSYWNRYKLNFDILNEHYVYPVDSYWIDMYSQPEPKYYYTNNDPCYAYYIGKDDNGIDLLQLYFPFRDKVGVRPRFIMNHSYVMGYNTLHASDNIVLTKSYKDIVAVHRVARYMHEKGIFSSTGSKLAITAISAPSETYKCTTALYDGLLFKYKGKYILYDFDKTGITYSNASRKIVPIESVFLTNGSFGTYNYGSKDYSDYLEASGLEATAKLTIDFLNYKNGRYSKKEI